MKLVNLELEELKRSSPARMRKRFASCVIDMIIVLFITALVFSGIFKITENTNAYKEEAKIVNSEIEYYNNFIEETHIGEYEDDKRISEEIIAYKNINRAIYLSYLSLGNNNQNEYIIDNNHNVTKYGLSSLENDNIAYFYTQYIPENDTEGKIINMYGQEPIGYLYDLYRDAFGTEFSLMFTLDKNINEMPILNAYVSYCIFHYLYIEDGDTIGEKGMDYYNLFSDAYVKMLEDATKSIIDSEPYHSTHYVLYLEAYRNQARYTNIGLLISLFIAYLIGVLLPKLLFKYERTIGCRLLGLGVIRMDGTKNKWYITLIKSLIGCIGYVIITMICYLFPPFNGRFEAFYAPFSINVNISLSLVALIILIIGTIVNMIGLFTHYRQNAINLIFNDKVVDTHYLDEGDIDDQYEGKSY